MIIIKNYVLRKESLPLYLLFNLLFQPKKLIALNCTAIIQTLKVKSGVEL